MRACDPSTCSFVFSLWISCSFVHLVTTSTSTDSPRTPRKEKGKLASRKRNFSRNKQVELNSRDEENYNSTRKDKQTGCEPQLSEELSLGWHWSMGQVKQVKFTRMSVSQSDVPQSVQLHGVTFVWFEHFVRSRSSRLSNPRQSRQVLIASGPWPNDLFVRVISLFPQLGSNCFCQKYFWSFSIFSATKNILLFD